jgi:hypothetical protein
VIKPIKIFRSLSFYFSSAGIRGLVWLNFENRILDLASMEIEKYVTRKFCLVINSQFKYSKMLYNILSLAKNLIFSEFSNSKFEKRVSTFSAELLNF